MDRDEDGVQCEGSEEDAWDNADEPSSDEDQQPPEEEGYGYGV